MTATDKLHIYDLLMTNYSVGDRVALSAVGNFLRAHDITPLGMGYEKLLHFFEDLSELCTLDSVQPRPGVPLVWYVTMLPRPEFEEEPADTQLPAAKPAVETVQLPPHLGPDMVFFPINLQNILSGHISGQQGSRATTELLTQVNRDYLTSRAENKIYHDTERDTYMFPLSTPAANGTQLVICIGVSVMPGRCPWIVRFVGPDFDNHFSAPTRSTKPGDALRNFAYLGNLAVFLRALAEHVQEEPWNFNGDADDYTILIQYINYTFYRLQMQDKVCIAEDGSFAAFNTGLQSRRLGEDVFAYFVPNAEGESSPWKFSRFCSADSNDPGERFAYKNMFGTFKEPEPATYFSKITDLLFDPLCEVRLSSDHIFKDNCDRLPMDFLRRECAWQAQAAALLDEIENAPDARRRRELFVELGEIIENDPDLFSSMHERLSGALSRTIKRVRRNYKLAVPCFFPTRNVMSMMLPISFTATGAPSLVLVCERTMRGDYLGQTILTLPMAYIDARLLCRPGSEWLNTSNIVSADVPDIGEE